MTLEELRAIKVIDVLESEPFRNRVQEALKKKVFGTRKEAQLMRRLRERRLTDVDVFVGVFADIIDKKSELPSNLRAYIFYIGITIYKMCVEELKAQVTDE